jgi:predicted dienelactone hydrolase
MNTRARLWLQTAFSIVALIHATNIFAQTLNTVGFRQAIFELSNTETTEVAIWYPSRKEEKLVTLGPTTMKVALNAEPIGKRHPLIVISHGSGGMNLNHHEIASAAAINGFIVLALTHPKDNYKDRSMVGKIEYFTERPRQVSRTLDALLADPTWAVLIDSSRIGFIGHSAGGFTGLALMGATPSIAHTVKHCAENYDDDLWFCNVSGSKEKTIDNAKNIAYFPHIQTSLDRRIKAAVLIAPVGAFNNNASLAAINTPTLVYIAQMDNVLIPKFHAEAIGAGITGAQIIKVNQGGHFMLVSKLNLPAETLITTNGADVNDDPAGFDRAATIAQASRIIPKWFSDNLK